MMGQFEKFYSRMEREIRIKAHEEQAASQRAKKAHQNMKLAIFISLLLLVSLVLSVAANAVVVTRIVDMSVRTSTSDGEVPARGSRAAKHAPAARADSAARRARERFVPPSHASCA